MWGQSCEACCNRCPARSSCCGTKAKSIRGSHSRGALGQPTPANGILPQVRAGTQSCRTGMARLQEPHRQQHAARQTRYPSQHSRQYLQGAPFPGQNAFLHPGLGTTVAFRLVSVVTLLLRNAIMDESFTKLTTLLTERGDQ